MFHLNTTYWCSHYALYKEKLGRYALFHTDDQTVALMSLFDFCLHGIKENFCPIPGLEINELCCRSLGCLSQHFSNEMSGFSSALQNLCNYEDSVLTNSLLIAFVCQLIFCQNLVLIDILTVDKLSMSVNLWKQASSSVQKKSKPTKYYLLTFIRCNVMYFCIWHCVKDIFLKM